MTVLSVASVTACISVMMKKGIMLLRCLLLVCGAAAAVFALHVEHLHVVEELVKRFRNDTNPG